MKTKSSSIFLLVALSVITFGVVRGYNTGVIAGELVNNHFEWQLQNYEGSWGALYYIVTFPVSLFFESSTYFKMQPASFHLALGGLSILLWLAITTYLLLRATEVTNAGYDLPKPQNVLPEEVDAFLELVSKIVIASGVVQGRPIVSVERYIERHFGLSDDQVVKAMKTFNYLMFSHASGRAVEVSRINVPKKLKRHGQEVFSFFCALVGDDGIFTKDELLVLEELRMKLDLSRNVAHEILRGHAISHSANMQAASVSVEAVETAA